VSYTRLVLITLVAVAAPLLLAFTPVGVPVVAAEVVGGILIGPHALGWARLDAPVEVLSSLGLATLLFLAGLEIRLESLQGPMLRLAGLGFALSLGLALVITELLGLGGAVDTPLLAAVILVSTSLGIVVIPLKDERLVESAFGQLVVAAASLAEIGAVLLLSLLFAQQGASESTQPVHLAIFVTLILVLAAILGQGDRVPPLARALHDLRDTSSQIRVRASVALLGVVVLLATRLGLDAILAAFSAGVVLGWLDGEDHTLRQKLEVVGFGVFVPVFFVASGMQLAVDDLLSSPSALLEVPLFLLAIVACRTVPALLYAQELGRRRALAAGFLQATTLSFVVVATQLGQEEGLMDATTAAAFVAAGLLSVLAFPAAGLALARERRARAEVTPARAS
jgi:Kef-type K+ transport system membrane component KefB